MARLVKRPLRAIAAHVQPMRSFTLVNTSSCAGRWVGAMRQAASARQAARAALLCRARSLAQSPRMLSYRVYDRCKARYEGLIEL
jgi:hypothetical protein